MDDVPLGTLFGALLILVLCSAFFSGTETALMCLNRYRLRHIASTGHRGARFAETLLKRPDQLIGVILFGNNLVNNAAAALVAVVALRLGGPAGVAIGTVAVTVFMLIFAEVVPKTLAATQPERLAFPGAYVYYALLRFFRPITWSVRLITLISNALLRLVGVRPEEGANHSLTIEELRTIVAESGALLPRKRQEIMIRVLELGEITVEDIMIPQNEVIGIDLDDDWEKITGIIQSSGYTRLPVYREAIDNVVGLLHVKRLIQHFEPEKLNKAVIESLVDEPYFVPEALHSINSLCSSSATGNALVSSWTSMATSRASSHWKTCWKRSSASSPASRQMRNPRSVATRLAAAISSMQAPTCVY